MREMPVKKAREILGVADVQGKRSLLSERYVVRPMPIWGRFERQRVVRALALARDSVGRSIAAIREMMAMTTSSSMSVKAHRQTNAAERLRLKGLNENDLRRKGSASYPKGRPYFTEL
jgi:hypothetical protein